MYFLRCQALLDAAIEFYAFCLTASIVGATLVLHHKLQTYPACAVNKTGDE